MSGQTIAAINWRALDREGVDRCRLSRVNEGWLLVGHARFREGAEFAALDYIVRCGEKWQTLGADIAGRHGDLEVNLRLECKSGDWFLNDVLQPQVRSAVDVDLSFTPATNLMPLRRRLSMPDGVLKTRAAWLRYPSSELQPLEQTYNGGQSAELVTYSAVQTKFTTQLCVDKSGFVTLYPGCWEGEVAYQTT